MIRKLALILTVIAISLIAVVPASANSGKPNFGPALYADGQTWGTKGVAGLPAPSGNNLVSFDKLFVIVNSNNPMGQLPVAEAAPGNPAYNGGRWYTQTVMWTADGFADHGTVPILTSYAEIMVHYNLGHLAIMAGSPAGGPPNFFECPLLPVK